MKRESFQSYIPKQTDLFANPSHIPSENKNISENRQEIKDKKPQISPKKTENEKVIPKEIPIKKVVKIMLFYSDSTYEFFNPERP